MITVLLAAAAFQHSVEAPIGEQVRVEVEEMSTTGYRWDLMDYDRAVVVLEKTELAPGPSPGASGLRVFEFRAVGRGRTVLRFRLERRWERQDKAPLREASVEVQVRP